MLKKENLSLFRHRSVEARNASLLLLTEVQAELSEISRSKCSEVSSWRCFCSSLGSREHMLF